MATFSLETYLSNILRNNHQEINELLVRPKNPNFNLYSLYLERQHPEWVSYTTDTASLFFCLTGELNFKAKEDEQKLVAGNLIFLEAKQQYDLAIADQQAILVKIKMQPGFTWKDQIDQQHLTLNQEKNLVATFEKGLLSPGYVCFKNTSVMWPTQILKQLISEYVNGNLFMWAMSNSFLNSVLCGSLRMQMFTLVPTEKTTINFEDQSLDEYIDAHYNDISLEAAAQYFGFNKNYFSSLVKEKTGKSFVDHVDDRRMHEARRLLAEPNISLKEIIERVGYSSKSFFYKKFNRYYGMTPAAMRKKLFQQANINLK